ncbi:MAG: Cys-Gln thioester bond-forming surface protein, partial [Oscillospiraceae bacterium]|nr:Cys-Gln thioester bond-forming surface protein [Oscillospiraceae bacterium]
MKVKRKLAEQLTTGKRVSRSLVALLIALMMLITALPSGLLGMLASAWEYTPGIQVWGTEEGQIGNYKYVPGINRNRLMYGPGGVSYMRVTSNGYAGGIFGRYGAASSRYNAENFIDVKAIYCIESGTSFAITGGYNTVSGTEAMTYHKVPYGVESVDVTSDWYWNALPAASREGILRTLLYGWKEGQSVPTPPGGYANADDMRAATQCLLWEFQQQNRLDPGYGHGDRITFSWSGRNQNGASGTWESWGDKYFVSIRGTNAEAYYNYILDLAAQHNTGWSFSRSTAGDAQNNTYVMDYNNGTYSVTLQDTNGILLNAKTVNMPSGITMVNNGGGSYTFRTNQGIPNGATITLKKDVGKDGLTATFVLTDTADHYQRMAYGAKDDKLWYVSFKTEEGTGKIVKTADGPTVAGFTFDFYGPLGKGPSHHYGTTGADGIAIIEHLPIGMYEVTETAAPNSDFKKPPTQTVEVRANETTTVSFYNEWKDGKL